MFQPTGTITATRRAFLRAASSLTHGGDIALGHHLSDFLKRGDQANLEETLTYAGSASYVAAIAKAVAPFRRPAS